MSEKDFFRRLWLQIAVTLVVFSLTGIGTAIGFYYSVKAKMEYYDRELQLKASRMEVQFETEKMNLKNDVLVKTVEEIKTDVKEIKKIIK